MAFGDVFKHAEVSAFALADFAARCGIDRKLMRREGQRLAKLAATEAMAQAQAPDYLGNGEQTFVQRVAAFVVQQADRLHAVGGRCGKHEARVPLRAERGGSLRAARSGVWASDGFE